MAGWWTQGQLKTLLCFQTHYHCAVLSLRAYDKEYKFSTPCSVIFFHLVLPHFYCTRAEVFIDEDSVAQNLVSDREGKEAHNDVPGMLGRRGLSNSADSFEGRTNVETIFQHVFHLVLAVLPILTSFFRNTTDTKIVTTSLVVHIVKTNLHFLHLGLESSIVLV